MGVVMAADTSGIERGESEEDEEDGRRKWVGGRREFVGCLYKGLSQDITRKFIY